MAVASRMASCTRWWSVLAALSAHVNCVHAHHTSQKTSSADPADRASTCPWSSVTTWVMQKTNTRSKNSSTNVTR